MTEFYGMTLEKLQKYLSEKNENPAKAKILMKAVYEDKISDFSEIKCLKSSLIQDLKENFALSLPKQIDRVYDETTEKLLFAMDDGKIIEAVIMNQEYGNSLCISSQIGCNMNCAFCRSGKNKKERNLEVFEMIGQVMYIEKILKKKISTITIMGIGEPFDNYENVMEFIDIAVCPFGFNIGQRHIAVSTCGIIPKIYAFSERKNINSLAVSLHAPNNELRNRLMPVNNTYPLEKLMEAVKDFCKKTRKRVFVEYIMLDGINDNLENATELAELLKNVNCTVNLIPYNDTQIEGFRRSPHHKVMAFYDVLKKHQIRVTMRREFGGDIKAACGQLKSDFLKNTK